MARGSNLRASDADRERVADRLRRATGEGRLLAEELEDRLERLFASRTYGELAALTSDLPAERAHREHAVPLWVRAGIVLAAALAVLAVTALVLLVIAGLAGAWMLWVVLGWAFLGHRGRGRRRRCSGGGPYRSGVGRGPSAVGDGPATYL